MKKNHLHICLYQPEIPQNTGNIGRLAAATASRLHLIKPFGFDTSDKQLRRPGLDYWPYLDLEIHDHFDEMLELFDASRFAVFSAKATRCYTQMKPTEDVLLFGQETKGLPESLKAKFSDQLYKIPIYHPGVRSLNLANSVAITLYHQFNQRKGTN